MAKEFFKDNKLFGLFSVISNKTIRKKESYIKRFRGHKNVPGIMVKTNRGYFLNGHHIDGKSVNLWFDMVKTSTKK